MNRIQALLVLFVTLAMVMESLPFSARRGFDHLHINHGLNRPFEPRNRVCLTGSCSDEPDEIRLGTRPRLLAQKARYISYEALKKDNVPCNRKGQSYYDCNKMGKVNPYRRGCSVITHCARSTD